MTRWLALAVIVLGGVPLTWAAADPLTLESGKPVILVCETQSTVVAPEAASTKGALRVRLEVKDETVPDVTKPDPAKPDRTGTWSVVDLAASHTASFAARLKDACAPGCPLYLAKGGVAPELWAPKRAALGTLAPGEPLTVAAIDAMTLKLRASTFIDKDIAALEQGECRVEK